MRVTALTIVDGRKMAPGSTHILNVKPIILAITTAVVTNGVISAIRSYLQVDTEGAAASDNLDTITDGNSGDLLILVLDTAGRIVTLRDAVGNLRLAGNFVFTSINDTITLIFDGTNWLEIGRSVNG